jgi:RimJ/RimL family protein N-acetyltransferase
MAPAQGFQAIENFDISSMAAFMRQPEIYWSASDAGAPPPEAMQIEAHLAHSHTWTLACCYADTIIGYVQLVQRTTIAAEIHTGFHANFRGIIAKRFIQYAIGRAFTDRALLKLWAIIPSDNRAAVRLARQLGFEHEGRLVKAIVRGWQPDDVTRTRMSVVAPGLYDLVILGLRRDQ